MCLTQSVLDATVRKQTLKEEGGPGSPESGLMRYRPCREVLSLSRLPSLAAWLSESDILK